MKIKIDTDLKTVEILEGMNLSILVKGLKVMLGKDYYDYIVVPPYTVYTYVSTPWTTIPWVEPNWKWPTITCSTGTYNLDIQSNVDLSKIDR